MKMVRSALPLPSLVPGPDGRTHFQSELQSTTSKLWTRPVRTFTHLSKPRRLTSTSLTDVPANPCALVEHRHDTSAQAEFFGGANNILRASPKSSRYFRKEINNVIFDYRQNPRPRGALAFTDYRSPGGRRDDARPAQTIHRGEFFALGNSTFPTGELSGGKAMSTTNGGLQHIREAVAARTSSCGVMSRETGVSLMKLDDFAAGPV